MKLNLMGELLGIYSAMNVASDLRMYGFFVYVRCQSQITKTGGPFYVPAIRISSVYYRGFDVVRHISAAFLCRMTFVFQSRFASPDPKLMHQCAWRASKTSGKAVGCYTKVFLN